MNELPAESHGNNSSNSHHGADSPGAMQVNEEHRAKYVQFSFFCLSSSPFAFSQLVSAQCLQFNDICCFSYHLFFS